MKRRTQRRKAQKRATRRVRKGLVFMGGRISNWKITDLLRNEKKTRNTELNALKKRGDFLKSIGLNSAEYNKLSEVQQQYVNSMYKKSLNLELTNNEKKGIMNYYQTYKIKSENEKQQENAAYMH